MKVLIALLKDQSGVTKIEYTLIAALISIAAIGATTTIGTDISTTFSTIASNL
jgi:pilus assembly protein Flp/PilA